MKNQITELLNKHPEFVTKATILLEITNEKELNGIAASMKMFNKNFFGENEKRLIIVDKNYKQEIITQ